MSLYHYNGKMGKEYFDLSFDIMLFLINSDKYSKATKSFNCFFSKLSICYLHMECITLFRSGPPFYLQFCGIAFEVFIGKYVVLDRLELKGLIQTR